MDDETRAAQAREAQREMNRKKVFEDLPDPGEGVELIPATLTLLADMAPKGKWEPTDDGELERLTTEWSDYVSSLSLDQRVRLVEQVRQLGEEARKLSKPEDSKK